MNLPQKPLIGSPCNQCGACCRLITCDIARIISPETKGPCQFIRLERDLSKCALIEEESRRFPAGKRLIALALGASIGCDALGEIDKELSCEDIQKRRGNQAKRFMSNSVHELSKITKTHTRKNLNKAICHRVMLIGRYVARQNQGMNDHRLLKAG
ncbi:hypothetical protein PT277_01645 [Acetobacteraceae bacterium ESL0709]|nr:hypothetical protein [Acetobacteraceae bacterium ESL0697]MDF7677405.1 hypothetical protein [Acetobacteraceae bacterium ESL0709]